MYEEVKCHMRQAFHNLAQSYIPFDKSIFLPRWLSDEDRQKEELIWELKSADVAICETISIAIEWPRHTALIFGGAKVVEDFVNGGRANKQSMGLSETAVIGKRPQLWVLTDNKPIVAMHCAAGICPAILDQGIFPSDVAPRAVDAISVCAARQDHTAQKRLAAAEVIQTAASVCIVGYISVKSDVRQIRTALIVDHATTL